MSDLFIVDAFTETAFRGNPAGVYFAEKEPRTEWMQSLSNEINLSETAFPFFDGLKWCLRWFTPRVEVRLCGHGTLAAAHLLWEEGRVPRNQPIDFYTLSGVLTAKSTLKGIQIDLPRMKVSLRGHSFGEAEAVYGLKGNVLARAESDRCAIIELEDAEAVRASTPETAKFEALGAKDLILTSFNPDSEYKVVSRFFAPSVGIAEDPVTGSAHCALADYWAKRSGLTDFLAFQASSRGGTLNVEAIGDRVLLTGKAVTVFSGSLSDKAFVI